MKTFNLSDWALGHRSLVWYFMLAFMAAGLFSYLQLGRQEDPDFTIKTMVIGAEWPGAAGDQDMGRRHHADLAAIRRHLDLVRPDKAALAAGGLHHVAAELMFQHLDLVVEGLLQPRDQVGGGDILLDPIGPAVEAALAPAGKIEHGFAQRFGRDRSGMNRDAADPPALFHHQNRPVELGELDGGPAAGRAGADDEHVVVIHRR